MRSLSRVFLPAVLASLSACAAGAAHRQPQDRATVTSEDLAGANEPIEVTLQKKVPGLRVTRTDGGEIALHIRGVSSFRGADSAPLWVLDGHPFEPGPGGVLTGIDPYNIESIKILRTAEAGMYGIQGAHGVIEITTKRPAPKSTP